MLQGLLFVLLFLLVFVVILIMVAATYAVRFVRKMKKIVYGNDDDGANDRHSANYTGRRQQQYANTRWNRANDNRRGTRGRIIDQRDPETINRKIIDDSVGEYVDFEETK